MLSFEQRTFFLEVSQGLSRRLKHLVFPPNITKSDSVTVVCLFYNAVLVYISQEKIDFLAMTFGLGLEPTSFMIP